MIIDYRENPDNLEQGVFDIPFDDYKKLPALNIHSLQHMRKTPAHFPWAMSQPDTRPSPDMIVGTCFDLALLNPGRFATVVPDTGEIKNTSS